MVKEILDMITMLGLWILIVFVAYYVRKLQALVKDQATIIEAYRSQSDYINNVQQTVSRLYDPSEIEKLVRTKVESEVRESEIKAHKKVADASEVINVATTDISALIGFISTIVWYLNDKALQEGLSAYREGGGSESWEKLIEKAHKRASEQRSEIYRGGLLSRAAAQGLTIKDIPLKG